MRNYTYISYHIFRTVSSTGLKYAVMRQENLSAVLPENSDDIPNLFRIPNTPHKYEKPIYAKTASRAKGSCFRGEVFRYGKSF